MNRFFLSLLFLTAPLLPELRAENTPLQKKAETMRLAYLNSTTKEWVDSSRRRNILQNNSAIVETQRKMEETVRMDESSIAKASPIFRNKVFARITVYWAEGAGTDHWSAKNQSSTGTKLKCLHHAAVDPKVIPYGSKLSVLHDGQKILVDAVDTGGAVVSRTASLLGGSTPREKNAPVIDLFFQKKTDALAYAETHPRYQWVDVIPPNTTLAQLQKR